MEWEIVPVSEAKVRIHELVQEAASHPIILVRRSRPEAVILSYADWMESLRELADLQDRLAVYRASETPADVRVSHEKLTGELGLLASDA